MRRTIAGLTALLIGYAALNAGDADDVPQKYSDSPTTKDTGKSDGKLQPVPESQPVRDGDCPDPETCEKCRKCRDGSPTWFCPSSTTVAAQMFGVNYYQGIEYTSDASCATGNLGNGNMLYPLNPAPTAAQCCPSPCDTTPAVNTTPDTCCTCIENCDRDKKHGKVSKFPGLESKPKYDPGTLYEDEETSYKLPKHWHIVGHTFVKLNITRPGGFQQETIPVRLIVIKATNPDPTKTLIPIFYGVGHELAEFPPGVWAQATIVPSSGAGFVRRVRFGTMDYVVALAQQ